jgi:hypothetical protein
MGGNGGSLMAMVRWLARLRCHMALSASS